MRACMNAHHWSPAYKADQDNFLTTRHVAAATHKARGALLTRLYAHLIGSLHDVFLRWYRFHLHLQFAHNGREQHLPEEVWARVMGVEGLNIRHDSHKVCLEQILQADLSSLHDGAVYTRQIPFPIWAQQVQLAAMAIDLQRVIPRCSPAGQPFQRW